MTETPNFQGPDRLAALRERAFKKNPELQAAMEREQREREMPVRELLNARRERAPKVVERHVATIEELAESLEVSLEQMAEVISANVAQFVESIREVESRGFIDSELSDLQATVLDQVYLLHAANQNEEAVTRFPWIASFATRDAFLERFVGDASPRFLSNLHYKLQRGFLSERNPRREATAIVRVGEKSPETIPHEVGNLDWVLLPDYVGSAEKYTFIEASVIDEIVEMLESGYTPPDLSHATTSVALQGIAEVGAIVSSASAAGRGLAVKSGEFGTGLLPGNMPLSSVYADRGGPNSGYGRMAWFDEYEVAFGISEARQSEFVRATEWYQVNKQEIIDIGSEGHLIGPEVPMQAVDTIYVIKKYAAEMTEWASRHAPQTKIYSLEAAQTLERYEKYVNQLALQENTSAAEAWRSLK